MKPIIFLIASTVFVSAEPDGEQLFTTNCSACHLLDQMVVGPSLAEMRGIYNGKPDEFVKWAVAPEKKRENVIEMPSMAHIGDEGLRAVYKYVMKVSEGVKVKEQEKGDPYAASPPHVAKPQVQRIFLPNAGPAAIAISLDAETSLCWDAGECRLRYAWTGGFIDGYPYWSGSGNTQASIVGTVWYTEAESPLKNTPKFSGYRIEDGFPIFQYRIGTTEITEGFTPLGDGPGFQRRFTFAPSPESAIELRFPSDQKVKYSSNKGEWSGTTLTLQPSDVSDFVINFSLK